MSAGITMAAWVLGAHLATAHPVANMQAHTPGLYVAHQPTQLAAGVLRNGNGHTNAWAARNFSTASGTYSLTVGAVAGVQRTVQAEQSCKTNRPGAAPRACWVSVERRELLPLLAASARMPISAHTALRVSAWPMRTDFGTRGAVSLSIEAAL